MSKEAILRIENALEGINDCLSVTSSKILKKRLKSLLKNLLVSEYYFKEAEKEISEDVVLKVIARYYGKYSFYPSRFEEKLGKNIFYALEYNNHALDASREIITAIEILQPNDEYKSENDNILSKLRKEYFHINYAEEFSKIRSNNKYFMEVFSNNHENFHYLVDVLKDYAEEVDDMAEYEGVFKAIKNKLIHTASELVSSRKSPTRGMEAASPWPKIKGCIAALSFGINLIDSAYSYMKISEWTACHFSDEEKPPQNHLEKSLRETLNNVGQISAVTLALGCRPSNYTV